MFSLMLQHLDAVMRICSQYFGLYMFPADVL